MIKLVNDQFSFPECEIVKGRNSVIQVPEYQALELIHDTQLRTEVYPEFRNEFNNTNDAVLGEDAPCDLYIATLLGQTSLLLSSEPYTNSDGSFKDLAPEFHSFFKHSFEPDLHEGWWKFGVKVCVDRRDEAYGALDCDHGENYISINFIPCTDVENLDLEQHP